MNPKERAALIQRLKPLAEEVKNTWLKAMLMRIEVHRQMALSVGAEPEDIPEIIIRAIETGSKITEQSLDQIGEKEKAKRISKGDF